MVGRGGRESCGYRCCADAVTSLFLFVCVRVSDILHVSAVSTFSQSKRSLLLVRAWRETGRGNGEGDEE